MDIYADYASLTPTDPRVLEEFAHLSRLKHVNYGNPSSPHSIGVAAKRALEEARAQAAGALSARPDEIVFTGTATEANNLAILGLVEGLYNAGETYVNMHIIVSAIEHSSIMQTARILSERGVRVSYIPVNNIGVVDLEALRGMVTRRTVLVSVMMVNNEIGTVQPIKEIAKIVRAEERLRDGAGSSEGSDRSAEGAILPIILHTDASQAFVYEDLDVRKLGVDMLTVDSHKIYGPRGVGLLWVAKGVPALAPVIVGGGQEHGLRSGTEALPTIMAFSYALRLTKSLRASEAKRVRALRDFFVAGLMRSIPGVKIYGQPAGSDTQHVLDTRNTPDSQSVAPQSVAPHIVNFTLPAAGITGIGIDHEYMAHALDARKIFVSTKSACLRDEDESYVLKAVNDGTNTVDLPGAEVVAHYGSLRVSFGRFTTMRQVRKILSTIVELYNSKSVQNSRVSVRV